MADITVDVNLPSSVSVDVTSPTQVLATNISIPGPQGPRGEKGNPTSINSLTAENIIITGVDGNIAYTSGTSTIFISGNSGYFQSAVNSLTTNLNSTGANLNTSINNLSGLFTGYTGNLDNNYATDAQLANTGSTLNTKINNLSGYVNFQDSNISNNLASTGSSLQTNINTLSSNLNSTGSNLENKITLLSGTLTGNYATIVNLASTGSTLSSNINSLSGLFTGYTGTLDATFASDIQLANTGTTLVNSINSLSGILTGNYLTTNSASSTYATISNLNSTGNTLNSSISSLSGTLTSNYATINNLALTESNLNTKIDNFSGTYQNFVDNLDSSYATDVQLQNTGSTLSQNINSLSGTLTGNYYLKSNPSGFITGVDLSSYLTSSNASSTYATIINLASTGSTLTSSINSLSGSSVLLYGDQSVGGVKTFRDNVYINNLFVTGTETIVSTNNFNVQSPYLLLNLTGGAVDGGIFFVTGSGLTGVNDTGAIIGFDHSNKFKFGVSTRNSDLSTLPDIASVQDITVYSGVADNKFSTITNLASTGNTLEQKISSLSGTLTSNYATISNLSLTGTTLQSNINTVASNLITTGNTLQTNINTVSSNLISTGNTLEGKISSLSGTLTSNYATITNLAGTGSTLVTNLASTGSTLTTNLASTGSTLNSSINSLSGTLTSNYATIINLASTGSTLNSNINSLSGTLTGNYATITNLASTGSTLDTKINNLSGYINSTSSNIIFTTGDQIKSGRLAIGDAIVDSSYPYTLSLQSNSPQTWLEILNHSGANQGVFFGITNNNFEQWNSQAGDILFVTSETPSNGTERLRIKNDGKVGIGTSAPSEKLEVNGNIKANNLVYNTGNQTISGNKNFAENVIVGDATQDDLLVVSGNEITFGVNPTVNGTGIVYTQGDQIISGTKTFQDEIPNLVINSDFVGSDGYARISLRGNGNDKLIIAQDSENYERGNNFIKSYTTLDIYTNTDQRVASFYDNVIDTANINNDDTIDTVHLVATSDISTPLISDNWNDSSAEINLSPNNIGLNINANGNWEGITLNTYNDNEYSQLATNVDKVNINSELNVTGPLNINTLDTGFHRNVYQFINSITLSGADVANANGTWTRLNDGPTAFSNGQGASNLYWTADPQQWNLVVDNGLGDAPVWYSNPSPSFDSTWGLVDGITAPTTTSKTWVSKNYNGIFFANNSTAVLVTGNQTISGVKTFIGNHNISGNTTVTGNLNVSGRIITPQQNKKFVYSAAITGGGNGTTTIAYGANCTLTPKYVGTLRADACISMWGMNGASTDTVQAASFWYGTGTAPVYSGNLVNLGGTRIGGLKSFQTTSTAINFSFPVGTSWVAEITGLNTGTQYWFDIGISGSNGRLRVQDVQLYIEEKY